MKVFEFSFEIDYGGGIMLIAARSLEEANEYVKENYPSKPWKGYWVYSQTLENLTASGDKPYEITSFTRVE
jgi:hypothetical protein